MIICYVTDAVLGFLLPEIRLTLKRSLDFVAVKVVKRLFLIFRNDVIISYFNTKLTESVVTPAIEYIYRVIKVILADFNCKSEGFTRGNKPEDGILVLVNCEVTVILLHRVCNLLLKLRVNLFSEYADRICAVCLSTVTELTAFVVTPGPETSV